MKIKYKLITLFSFAVFLVVLIPCIFADNSDRFTRTISSLDHTSSFVFDSSLGWYHNADYDQSDSSSLFYSPSSDHFFQDWIGNDNYITVYSYSPESGFSTFYFYYRTNPGTSDFEFTEVNSRSSEDVSISLYDSSEFTSSVGGLAFRFSDSVPEYLCLVRGNHFNDPIPLLGGVNLNTRGLLSSVGSFFTWSVQAVGDFFTFILSYPVLIIFLFGIVLLWVVSLFRKVKGS